jgi:hypothetical protein
MLAVGAPAPVKVVRVTFDPPPVNPRTCIFVTPRSARLPPRSTSNTMSPVNVNALHVYHAILTAGHIHYRNRPHRCFWLCNTTSFTTAETENIAIPTVQRIQQNILMRTRYISTILHSVTSPMKWSWPCHDSGRYLRASHRIKFRSCLVAVAEVLPPPSVISLHHCCTPIRVSITDAVYP